jgi:hypothetical protein
MLYSGKKVCMRNNKGKNSKILKGRVIILVHCTLPE